MVFKKGQVSWNKGKKISEETRKKMMGRKHSEESRKKMSNSHKGLIQSEETIRKRIEKTCGKKRTIEQCKRISDACMGRTSWNLNKHFSEETKQKMRENNARAMLGKHQSEEMKNKIKLTHLGRHRSEETKKRISESHLGVKNPQWGKLPWNKGVHQSGMIGRHHSEESKRKMSATKKEQWKDEDFARRNILAMQIVPNGKELYLDFLLQNHFPDEWKFVGDGQVIIEGLCPDFINVNGKKQIIELFGDYWHKCKKNMKKTYTESGRIEYFKKYGYETLIIWEHELCNEQEVIEKIKEFSQ